MRLAITSHVPVQTIPEDTEHVVFSCPRFIAHRVEAKIDARAWLSPENNVDQMLASEEKLMKAIRKLLRKKELRKKVKSS